MISSKYLIFILNICIYGAIKVFQAKGAAGGLVRCRLLNNNEETDLV